MGRSSSGNGRDTERKDIVERDEDGARSQRENASCDAGWR